MDSAIDVAAATDCVFCLLIAGSIDAHTIYSDETAIAFLDIAPVARGHTLVVPKRHVANITSEGAPIAIAEVATAMHEVGSLLIRALGAAGLNVFQVNGAAAGQEVGHLHLHLVPRLAHDPRLVRWRRDDSEARRLVETHAMITRDQIDV
jgi:histidine triad (HIT) family protein